MASRRIIREAASRRPGAWPRPCVPGTGWPEPGGFLPREALKLLGLVAAEGLCGLEVVEVSPPYDTSDITALVGVRVVVETLGSLVAHGKLGAHKHLIDKPVAY